MGVVDFASRKVDLVKSLKFRNEYRNVFNEKFDFFGIYLGFFGWLRVGSLTM